MLRLRLLASLVLLLISSGTPVLSEKSEADAATSTHHNNGRRINLSGVPNAGQVTPKLYRGAQPTPEGFRQLKEMGVGVVVDVRLTGRDKEKQQVTKLGMQYISLPWHCYFPKDKVMARFLTVLREHRGEKVFVHCRYGDDRTGMMIAAYRMANQGWTPAEARKEMEVFGFHHLVCPALGPYEKNFPGHFKKNDAFKDLRATNATTAPN
jgi:protein-tyrosine phosphatase